MKKEEQFKINCKACKSDKIQINIEGDSGYSNYTVMSDGKIAFKCVSCGKYGSTDDCDKPNELSNFNVRCLGCDSQNDWKYHIQDVEGSTGTTKMFCPNCGNNIQDDIASPLTPNRE